MPTERVVNFHQILLFWKLDSVLFLENAVFHVVVQLLPVYVLKISFN